MDLKLTQDTEKVLEVLEADNTACLQHNITPVNKIQQKLEKLIKTTEKILDIESNTDKVRLFIKFKLNY